MPKYFCKYCGRGADNPAFLTRALCPCHPLGNGKGFHELYSGRHDAEGHGAAYVCRHCGRMFRDLRSLVTGPCPARSGKAKHEAL